MRLVIKRQARPAACNRLCDMQGERIVHGIDVYIFRLTDIIGRHLFRPWAHQRRLHSGQAFFTGNRVARAGADGSSVLGTIFYKSSDPKRLKYIPARRHILPFSTGKYVCREDTDDFAAQVCALLQQEDYGSLAALSYNGRDIPVTAEDTEEYFHDDLVYFRKNVGDLSLLEGTTVYHDTPWATAVTIRYYSKEAQETYSDYLPITVKDGHYRLDLRWKY